MSLAGVTLLAVPALPPAVCVPVQQQPRRGAAHHLAALLLSPGVHLVIAVSSKHSFSQTIRQTKYQTFRKLCSFVCPASYWDLEDFQNASVSYHQISNENPAAFGMIPQF